jgi:hypothetical protein
MGAAFLASWRASHRTSRATADLHGASAIVSGGTLEGEPVPLGPTGVSVGVGDGVGEGEGNGRAVIAISGGASVRVPGLEGSSKLPPLFPREPALSCAAPDSGCESLSFPSHGGGASRPEGSSSSRGVPHPNVDMAPQNPSAASIARARARSVRLARRRGQTARRGWGVMPSSAVKESFLQRHASCDHAERGALFVDRKDRSS